MGIMDSISSSLGFGGGSSDNAAYNDVAGNNNETSFLGSAVNGIKEAGSNILHQAMGVNPAGVASSVMNQKLGNLLGGIGQPPVGGSGSIHHNDHAWCTIGPIAIMYHTTISMSTSVTYEERTVFGSHGAYAVWTGTAPRTYSVSASMVAANSDEVLFNIAQVAAAYKWTQESPPHCYKLSAPGGIFNTSVRIESFDSSIPEGTHLDGFSPIQIDLSLSLKECKPI